MGLEAQNSVRGVLAMQSRQHAPRGHNEVHKHGQTAATEVIGAGGTESPTEQLRQSGGVQIQDGGNALPR